MSHRRYLKAVTFGRFNLGHSGHIDLIKAMLSLAEEAHVYVSSGKANNDWDLRVMLLKHLCLEADIKLKRVKFLKQTSPFAAVEEAVNGTSEGSNVIVLGTDQQALARNLGDKFECRTVLNPRINSSTQVRHLIDDERFKKTLNKIYNNNDLILTLVKVLRKQEKRREESIETSAET